MLSLTITGGVTVLSSKPAEAVVTVVAAGIGIAVLVPAWRVVKQTTLAAAWGWSAAAILAWSGVEFCAALLSAGQNDGPWAGARLTAISLSLCPVVAVLGAKRPQHTAWQFVVLSLWGILALPAAEAFFLHRGGRLEVGELRGWLLWILLTLGPINYGPTRYGVASLVNAVGQVLALSPHLPLLQRRLVPHSELVGLAICVIGLAMAWMLSKLRRRPTNSIDAIWFDFRDAFGLFWALRVEERVNAASRQSAWRLILTWNGLRTEDTSGAPGADAAVMAELRSSLRGLLRRFVTSDWIEQRSSIS